MTNEKLINMQIKKILTIVLVFVTASALVVACGGSKQGSRGKLQQGDNEKKLKKLGVSNIEAKVVCQKAALDRRESRQSDLGRAKTILDLPKFIDAINDRHTIRFYTSDLRTIEDRHVTHSELLEPTTPSDSSLSTYVLKAHHNQLISIVSTAAPFLSHSLSAGNSKIIDGLDLEVAAQDKCSTVTFRGPVTDEHPVGEPFEYQIVEDHSSESQLVLEVSDKLFKGAQIIVIKRLGANGLRIGAFHPHLDLPHCTDGETVSASGYFESTLEFATRLEPGVRVSRHLLDTIEKAEIHIPSEVTEVLSQTGDRSRAGYNNLTFESLDALLLEARTTEKEKIKSDFCQTE